MQLQTENNMKVTTEHYAYMADGIDRIFRRHGMDNIVKKYESGDFPRSEKTQNLQLRFMWDMYHFSGVNRYICDNADYKDDHITTALKRICPTVTRRY